MNWIGYVLITGLTCALLGTLLGVMREKRLISRFTAALCPDCGKPIGPQNNIRHWVARIDPMPKDAVNSGMIVVCGTCGSEMRVTESGWIIGTDHKKKAMLEFAQPEPGGYRR